VASAQLGPAPCQKRTLQGSVIHLLKEGRQHLEIPAWTICKAYDGRIFGKGSQDLLGEYLKRAKILQYMQS
jgi:hypothetical protein